MAIQSQVNVHSGTAEVFIAADIQIKDTVPYLYKAVVQISKGILLE